MAMCTLANIQQVKEERDFWRENGTHGLTFDQSIKSAKRGEKCKSHKFLGRRPFRQNKCRVPEAQACLTDWRPLW